MRVKYMHKQRKMRKEEEKRNKNRNAHKSHAGKTNKLHMRLPVSFAHFFVFSLCMCVVVDLFQFDDGAHFLQLRDQSFGFFLLHILL